MKPFVFRQAEFIKSAARVEQCPDMKDDGGQPLVEIAAAGRSNVGKSTLINNLLCRKKLAKTSQTPGKTQLLNFFLIDERMVFTDLPGYGYAAVPEKVRRQWGKMIERYVEESKRLELVLFLLDIRRMPNDDDLQLLEWLNYLDKKVILVLTKADKLTRNQRQAKIKKILAAFHSEDLPYVSYSSTKNIGRDALIQKINQVLGYGINE